MGYCVCAPVCVTECVCVWEQCQVDRVEWCGLQSLARARGENRLAEICRSFLLGAVSGAQNPLSIAKKRVKECSVDVLCMLTWRTWVQN